MCQKKKKNGLPWRYKRLVHACCMHYRLKGFMFPSECCCKCHVYVILLQASGGTEGVNKDVMAAERVQAEVEVKPKPGEANVYYCVHLDNTMHIVGGGGGGGGSCQMLGLGMKLTFVCSCMCVSVCVCEPVAYMEDLMACGGVFMCRNVW